MRALVVAILLISGSAIAQPVVVWRPPMNCAADRFLVWSGSAWTCSSGAAVTGSGTTNRVVKFTSAGVIGDTDFPIVDAAGTLTLGNSDSDMVALVGSMTITTSGQSALFTTRHHATSNGQNIWIGGGGQSTTASVAAEGAGNTSLGWSTLNASTSAKENTCVGQLACQAITTGSQNVAVGVSALTALTTANAGDGGNVAIGYKAMAGCTTSFYNIAIGAEAIGAGTCTSSSHGNIALGHNTLKALTNGVGNLCIGDLACAAATTSTDNIAIGTTAFQSSSTGGDVNIAIGKAALGNVTTGDANTVVGSLAASGVITSGGNTVMGYNTVTAMTGAENNVFGYNNSGLTSGSQNTIIGSNIALQNVSNHIILNDGNGNGQTQVIQLADHDITDAGLTDSNNLTISTLANGIYGIEALIIAGGNDTTGDYLFDFAVSAGTMDCTGTQSSVDASDAVQHTAIIATAAADTNDTTVGTRADVSLPIAIRISIACKVSDATTLKFRFGNASAAGGRVSRTMAGSFLRWDKLN